MAANQTANHKLVAALCMTALDEQWGVRIITPEPQRFKQYFYQLTREPGSLFSGLSCRNDPDDPHNAVFVCKTNLAEAQPGQVPQLSAPLEQANGSEEVNLSPAQSGQAPPARDE